MNANRLQVAVGDLICSTTSEYEVQHLLGSGNFGVVTKCKKLATNEMVAVKILKSKRYIKEAKQEEMILKKMKESDSHKFNIVRWNDSFAYMGHLCLEFEKLDMGLDEFMQTCSNSLKLVEIRPIVQQLATALEFLMGIGIVHADLKLANIMMVEQFNQPLRVNFGLASDNPRACTGLTLQTLWYIVKTSVELMKACNDLRSDGDNATYATLKTCMSDYHSGPDEDHLAGLSGSEEPILNSTDDTECGNR
ncbi:Homeodomain-interacting protein kinase 1 [Collichthys lucidus]|uniref:Homeodomain-interacting protein kinase 1 n=1 Tax=Collichthys lucidus TaxID=240159 RepID=A0A4U5UJ88_COLLU|nr:Homeodomain-interacting protein kinase 1 [Collichthys lucidus]